MYYGWRYYSPGLGRWISRDPAAEQGAINLCLALNNSPLCIFDTDGRWPSTLAEWTKWGALSKAANWGLTLSGLAKARSGWLATIALIWTIDDAMNGTLLQNVNGRAGVVGLMAAGQLSAKSFAKAALSARLSAIQVVGSAVENVLGGTRPTDTYSSAGLAYSFVQESRRGDNAWADLDAVLLGARMGVDAYTSQFTTLRGGVGLATALIKGDAAAIAAKMPNYTALNAWDMLSNIEIGLESPTRCQANRGRCISDIAIFLIAADIRCDPPNPNPQPHATDSPANGLACHTRPQIPNGERG